MARYYFSNNNEIKVPVRFDNDWDYFNQIQPYYHAEKIPTDRNMGLFSFSLDQSSEFGGIRLGNLYTIDIRAKENTSIQIIAVIQKLTCYWGGCLRIEDSFTPVI